MTLRGVEKPVPASSIRIARTDGGGAHDPICGLPLTEDTAQEIAHDVRGLHGAVLLAGLRRHLAPPAGTLAVRLTAPPRCEARTWAPGVDPGFPLNICCQ